MKDNTFHIQIDKDLKEQGKHGDMEFPATLYHVHFNRLHLGLVQWHWHEEIEIDVVTEGKMISMIGEDTIELEKDDIILTNVNTLHSFRPASPSIPCCADAIIFHPAVFFGFGRTHINVTYLVPLTKDSNLKYMVIRKDNPLHKEFFPLLQEYTRILDAKEFGYVFSAKAVLCNIWSILLREHIKRDRETTTFAPSQSEPRVKDAVLYIQKHYMDPITLDDIAGEIHVSKSECCRSFKKIIHLSPFEYLMKYRIFSACTLILQDQDKKLSYGELALQVGFNNASYFNKVFKKCMGCTPKEYRKKSADTVAISTTDFFSY